MVGIVNNGYKGSSKLSQRLTELDGNSPLQKSSQEKLKTMVMQNWGGRGGGALKCYSGICLSGKWNLAPKQTIWNI